MNIQENVTPTNILILCTPSAGILDSWLPVLVRLQEVNPGITFSIIFPRNRTVSEIDVDSTLIQNLEKKLERVVFRGNENLRWYQCDSFQQAIEQDQPSKLEKKLKKRLRKNKLTRVAFRYIQKIIQRLNTVKNRKKEIDLGSFLNSFSAIFYDVYEHDKSYNEEVISHSQTIPKFSIVHGLNPLSNTIKQHTLSHPDEHINTTAFLFSDNEKNICSEKFGVPPENIVVTGIQRHDPDWIQYYINLETEKQKADSLFDDDYIFIISRPDSTDYLPTDRMKKSIRTIRKLAFEKLNVKLVIKLHPKEKNRGLYEEILGVENYGKTWMYSNAHPFTIGSNCMFAVSYFSGVAVDLIALDVPTIELLDLRGIDRYDKFGERKDEKGVPVLNYRYNNLVLGASTEKEFFSISEKILADKQIMTVQLRKSYEKIYTHPERSIEKTVETILQKINTL